MSPQRRRSEAQRYLNMGAATALDPVLTSSTDMGDDGDRTVDKTSPKATDIGHDDVRTIDKNSKAWGKRPVERATEVPDEGSIADTFIASKRTTEPTAEASSSTEDPNDARLALYAAIEDAEFTILQHNENIAAEERADLWTFKEASFAFLDQGLGAVKKRTGQLEGSIKAYRLAVLRHTEVSEDDTYLVGLITEGQNYLDNGTGWNDSPESKQHEDDLKCDVECARDVRSASVVDAETRSAVVKSVSKTIADVRSFGVTDTVRMPEDTSKDSTRSLDQERTANDRSLDEWEHKWLRNGNHVNLNLFNGIGPGGFGV